MKTLAILTTHPIQYNAPLFKLLAERGVVGVRVFYTWPQAIEGFNDPDFGVQVKWDLPLLEGYDYELVENTSKHPSSKSYGGIVTPGLFDRLTQYAPDAILVFGWKLKGHLQVMRHFKGKVPIWFRGDSTLLGHPVKTVSDIHLSRLMVELKEYFKFKLRKISLTWVYQFVDKAFYVGEHNKMYFKEHGLRENQLVFAPHAIDNSRFSGGGENKNKQMAELWREEHNISPDDFVLVYAGKFEPRKNLVFFLSTVLDLMSSEWGAINKIKLVLFGNGPQEAQLRKMSLNCGNVLFMPFQNQLFMPVVYRLCDLYCLPSQSETWGLAVNEAMACGCPVLVSDRVGCAVDLATQWPHQVFESGNKEALKKAIVTVYERRGQIDSANIQRQIESWSFSAIAEALERELEMGC
ncbi:MAG: glycosyltransferase family 4 protein [Breznakibacter sp.]